MSWHLWRDRIYGSHQNLAADTQGFAWSELRHGRAWVHLGEVVLVWEWSLGGSFCHASVDVGGEDDLKFSLAIPLLAFWLHIENLLPHTCLPRSGSRTTGLRIFSGAIWVDLWNDNSWGGRDKPWYQSWNLSLADTFLGQQLYGERPLGDGRVTVDMPEGLYPATVTLFESSWHRPRWPRTRRLLRATITPDLPIPIPGKGENSWDCEDDATSSLTCPVATAAAAAATLRESCMETRQRHGGPNWVPDAGWPVRFR